MLMQPLDRFGPLRETGKHVESEAAFAKSTTQSPTDHVVGGCGRQVTSRSWLLHAARPPSSGNGPLDRSSLRLVPIIEQGQCFASATLGCLHTPKSVVRADIARQEPGSLVGNSLWG